MGETKETAAISREHPLLSYLENKMVNLYFLVRKLNQTVANESLPADLRHKASEWLAEIRWMYRGEG